MIFALVGNQNCGKTTLFNALTGSNQHVGNFPGVTVDQKVGEVKGAPNCSVVDLPGIYSIRPYSQGGNRHPGFCAERQAGRHHQYCRRDQHGAKSVFNPAAAGAAYSDGGRSKHDGRAHRQRRLCECTEAVEGPGGPCGAHQRSENEGVSELVRQFVRVAKDRVLPQVMDFCPVGPVHRCIHAVSHLIEDHAQRAGSRPGFAPRSSLKETNPFFELLELRQNERELLEHSIIEMEHDTGMDRNAALAAMRYDFIEKAAAESVVKARESKEHRRSVRIDAVLTNRFAALPLFLCIMFLVFYLTFHLVGAWLSDLLSLGIDGLTSLTDQALTAYGINPVVHSLIIDGIFCRCGKRPQLPAADCGFVLLPVGAGRYRLYGPGGFCDG